MRTLITGATGTVGRALIAALLERGDEVAALTRDRAGAERKLGVPGRAAIEIFEWRNPLQTAPPPEAFAGADAVVNLIGEPISQRWTDEAKARINDSRVIATRNLVAGLSALAREQRPRVLVSGSATGFYGSRGSEPIDESASAGVDFLARVVVAWESEAQSAEELLRVTTMRTGVVLSPRGGALATMLPFFKLGVGGPIAGGRQFVPWVHLDDVVGALVHVLDEDSVNGPFNVAAPEGSSNAEFSRALGRALHRPAFLPVPGVAVRLLYGEMARVVLTGVHAVPHRLSQTGYEFKHPELEPALRDVLSAQ